MVWFYNKELDLLSKVVDSSGAKSYDVAAHTFTKRNESDIGIAIHDAMARRILLRMDIDFAIKEFMKSQRFTFGEIGTDALFGGRLAVKAENQFWDVYCSHANGHICYVVLRTEHNPGEIFWAIDHETFRDKLYCLANQIPKNGDFSFLSYYPEWWTSESNYNFGEMRFFSDADKKSLFLCDASGFQLRFEPAFINRTFADLPSKSGRVFLGKVRPLLSDYKLNLSEGYELTTREVDWFAYMIWENEHDYYYERLPEYQEDEDVDYRDEDYSDELGPECNWPDYD